MNLLNVENQVVLFVKYCCSCQQRKVCINLF